MKRPANYAAWRKEQRSQDRIPAGESAAGSDGLFDACGGGPRLPCEQRINIVWPSNVLSLAAEQQQIRVKHRVFMHIAQGPAREREALKRV
jgi:hypothetical protein